MNTWKSLRKALSLSALPLLLALSTAEVGCLGHRGPSEVAQGQRYETGDPTYDQFFAAVHDLQVDLAKAPQQEAKLRIDFGKPLGVEPEEVEDEPAPTPKATPAASTQTADATPSATDAYEDQLKQSAINAVPGGSTVNAVSQQVGQLKSIFGSFKAAAPEKPAAAPAPKKKEKRPPSAAMLTKAMKSRAQKLGLEMKLELERGDDAKATLRTGGETESADSKQLSELVQKTAKSELELLGRMTKAKKKLDKLASLSVALEANVETAFRKSRGRGSEVQKNLDDAQALIELMQGRAADVSKKAEHMLSKLEDAASAQLDAPQPEQAPVDKAVAEKSAPEKTTTPKAETKAKSGAKPEKKPARPQPRASKPALGDFEP